MIFIQDNFLKDPFQARRLALKANYEMGDNYPGGRSFSVPHNIRDFILSESSRLLNEPMLEIIQRDFTEDENISFQYCTAKFREGMYHTDIPIMGSSQEVINRSKYYSAMLYLTPNPPINSGLDVCDYDAKVDIESTDQWIKHYFYQKPDSLHRRIRYSLVRRRCNRTKPFIRIQNKFNRFVLFDGELFHKQQKFFGSSIKDARLTIATFFEFAK